MLLVRNRSRRLWIIFASISIGASLFMLLFSSNNNQNDNNQMETGVGRFEGFDNTTGADHFIVPNTIHFIRFRKSNYSFVDYLCLRAAFINHRPDHFFIHTDVTGGFTGKYWDLIQKDRDLSSRIRILPIEVPTEIFGQRLSEQWQLFHGSDIARIQVVMKYGGIYLDNDVYVIKNLDKYRKFEITMNWDEGQFLGSQVIIAHKDARFLRMWLNSYKDYHSDLWYYNAGQLPTTSILEKTPEVLHRVKVQFGADTTLSWYLYVKEDFDWRSLDAIHLMINHRVYMDPYYNELEIFDEYNIRNYKFPFGQMAREIVDASNMNLF